METGTVEIAINLSIQEITILHKVFGGMTDNIGYDMGLTSEENEIVNEMFLNLDKFIKNKKSE